MHALWAERERESLELFLRKISSYLDLTERDGQESMSRHYRCECHVSHFRVESGDTNEIPIPTYILRSHVEFSFLHQKNVYTPYGLERRG